MPRWGVRWQWWRNINECKACYFFLLGRKCDCCLLLIWLQFRHCRWWQVVCKRTKHLLYISCLLQWHCHQGSHHENTPFARSAMPKKLLIFAFSQPWNICKVGSRCVATVPPFVTMVLWQPCQVSIWFVTMHPLVLLSQ